MAHEEADQERNPNTLYEVQDASVREVIWTGVGVALGVVIVCIVVWGLFNALKVQTAAEHTFNPMQEPRQYPPEPRLQEHPAVELRNLRKHEDDILNTYGWVDKNAGTVHIPIYEAINQVAQRGLPARSAAEIAAAEAGRGPGPGPEPRELNAAGKAVQEAQPKLPNAATLFEKTGGPGAKK
jgi:hypothetical protein